MWKQGSLSTFNHIAGKIILASQGGGFKAYEKGQEVRALGRIFIGQAGRDTPNVGFESMYPRQTWNAHTAYIKYEHALENDKMRSK